MPTDNDWVLYDTAVFGATALAESVLFQVAQGADGTHTENFTNSRGSPALPSEETFTCKEIHCIVDHNTALADIPKLFTGAFLEIRVSDLSKIKLPLQMCSSYNAYGGHYSQAAAADEAVIGLIGTGYILEIPIIIPGGTQWRVRVVQGPLAVTANSFMKISLRGILRMS